MASPAVVAPAAAPAAVPPSAEPDPARDGALYPFLYPGQDINAYSDAELAQLARWIRSDGILRTEDEMLTEMMRELGFQRRGKNVVAKLRAAIVGTK
jgi:hypothetical protein